MSKTITFDRKGRCPICRQEFRSEQCPHSWEYVHRVVEGANQRRKGQDFNRDVSRLARGRRHA